MPVSLTDERARVRQIWGNLLINGVSFDDAGTYVCHGVSPIAAELSVSDHSRVYYKLLVHAPTDARLLLEQHTDKSWLVSV